MKKILSVILLLCSQLSFAQSGQLFINPYFDGGFTPCYGTGGGLYSGAAIGSIVKPGINILYMFSRQFGVASGISYSRYQYETNGHDSTRPHYGLVQKEVQQYTDIPLYLHITLGGKDANRRSLFYMDAGISFSFLARATYQQRYVPEDPNTLPDYTPLVDNKSDFNSFALKYIAGCGFIYGIKHRVMFETGLQFSGFITKNSVANPQLLRGYTNNSPVDLPTAAIRIGFHIRLGSNDNRKVFWQ